MGHILILMIPFCLLLTGIPVYAQSTIPAAGGNADGAGGTSSYTVGQVFYHTLTETSGTVTEGVQQPYEILVVTRTEEALKILLECSIYPNPATDLLKLKIGNYDNNNLYYHLYDIQGNLLENKKVITDDTHIMMNNLVPGTYFLKVTDNRKIIKTFKIVKN